MAEQIEHFKNQYEPVKNSRDGQSNRRIEIKNFLLLAQALQSTNNKCATRAFSGRVIEFNIPAPKCGQ
jgi:hypothetical protein